MAAAAREVAQALGAQPEQAEGDLVVSGKYGRNRATVRFSSSPDKPPLVLQLQVPLLPWLNAGSISSGQQAYFTFSLVPRESAVKERGTILATGDQVLDSRFIARCDNPSGAKPFVQDKQVRAELQKLGCSPKTFLRIQGVNMELVEMGGTQNGRHILAHLESMSKLVGATPGPAAKRTTGSFQMPSSIRLPSLQLPKFLGERGPIILAAGAAVLIAVVIGWSMLRVKEEKPTGLPAGMTAADAALIPDAAHWALVTDKELDPAALDWLRNQGQTPSARFAGDFFGSEPAGDVVYLLKHRAGMMRVVILSGGRNRYDNNFGSLAVVARVPKSVMADIHWTDMPAVTPDGDGLLVVRKGNDPVAALMVMAIHGKVTTAHPPDYQQLHLQ